VKIVLESTYGDLNFKGTNERGQSVQLSGSKEAASPMEAVLMAVAACSSVDIEMLLKKMRQPYKGVSVSVEGIRADAVPAVFTDIFIHYIIYGDVQTSKAKKAVEMSMDKYCSVSIMLSKSVKISHSFEVKDSKHFSN
jgi:putative redox protein